MTKSKVNTGACGLVGKDMIKFRTLYLIGCPPTSGLEILAEINSAMFFAALENSAVFVLETCFFKGGQKTGTFKHIHAIGQQTFADDEAWKLLRLKHCDVKSCIVKQFGHCTASGTGANDGDIAILSQFACPVVVVSLFGAVIQKARNQAPTNPIAITVPISLTNGTELVANRPNARTLLISDRKTASWV